MEKILSFFGSFILSLAIISIFIYGQDKQILEMMIECSALIIGAMCIIGSMIIHTIKYKEK